jgi:hypothetical protein
MISMAALAEPSKKSMPRIRWIWGDGASDMFEVFFHSLRSGSSFDRMPKSSGHWIHLTSPRCALSFPD